MKSITNQMAIISSLAESLKIRHLDDEKKFEEVYGEEIWNKFGGLCLIAKAFIKESESLNQRINRAQYL